MLYLIYWELNENMSVENRYQTAQRLTSSELFPPKGINIIRWDITPDLWGIAVIEAENVADVIRCVDLWRAAETGFIKFVKTSPIMPVEEYIPFLDELLKSLAQ